MRSLITREVRRAVKSPKLLTETKVCYRCSLSQPLYRDDNGKLMAGSVLSYWPLHFTGEHSSMKHIIIPLSGLVPSQRPVASGPDSRFRDTDRVWFDWVRLQIDIFHWSTVRFLAFAFPNSERRNVSVNSVPYRFAIPNSKTTGGSVAIVPTELYCYPLSTEDLIGTNEKKRQVGVSDGPFAYTRNNLGDLVWNSSDGTAWNAVVSRSVGRPIGEISSRIDNGPQTPRGSMCKFMLPVRADQGTNKCYRHLDLFFRIGRWQKFKNPGNSLVEGENPLELLMFFDCPCPGGDDDMDIEPVMGAKVTGLTVEACFRS